MESSRHLDAARLRHAQHAGGHVVIAGKDGGRAWLAGQQSLGAGDARFERVLALLDQPFVDFDAGLRHRIAITLSLIHISEPTRPY